MNMKNKTCDTLNRTLKNFDILNANALELEARCKVLTIFLGLSLFINIVLFLL